MRPSLDDTETRFSCLQKQLSVAKLERMNTLSHLIASNYGSRARFAAAIGLSSEAVRKWEIGRVPAERCLEIERLSQGAITVHDLRPDVFGPPQDTNRAAA